ncbi:bifunctional 2-polyprenyl-6-hydroxyphenol methylase/3-demethylubiquinol 3-O-methyltransferase UbiG [Rhodovibrionaceae bacterium A322]
MASQNRAAGVTVDAEEVDKFSRLAEKWWDLSGEFAPLHKLNPLRVTFLRDQACQHFDRDPKSDKPLQGVTVLDVGCGGGLLSEPLARLGATVTALDASEVNVKVARAHARQSGLEIDYRCQTAESLAESGAVFDLVVSMEVVEHVASVADFLEACAAMVKPEGALCLATLNRTPKSFLLGIVAAEHLLRWVPTGTHDWRKFRKPSELAAALRPSGLEITALSGMAYNVLSDSWYLSKKDVDVNYLLFASR